MITDAATREHLRSIILPIRKRLKAHRESSHGRHAAVVGFGIMDEDEYRKAQIRHAAESAATFAAIAELEFVLHQIETVYGVDAIRLTIEEGERRIGSLPYVD